MPPEPAAANAGLLGSVRRVVRTALTILATRLQILATELEEERVRFAEFALILLGIAFSVGMAILLAVIFVVVALWDTHRLVTLGAFSGLFFALAVGGVLLLRHRRLTRPKLFESTLGEIAKDIQRVRDGA
jgi:uncharacterized membrane protein YqjE